MARKTDKVVDTETEVTESVETTSDVAPLSRRDKMADEKPKFQSEIKLPNGAVVSCKKPTNGVRRALLEQPETNLRFIIEIIASACITKMVLPEGYSEEHPEGVELEFTDEDLKTAWNRLDKLDLLDTQAFIEVFQEHNIPSPEMIKQLLDATKAGKK